ncbi:indole-3-acetic acid-induced protein ARG7 [Syzygium oleosum]|uniref:indole-3-acetic acid-induced protein ARG7 n=1 Tax=Syzygium oleosum TaxID=219896 RepID=UPI0011D23AB9|nr:indole-3-acetic acid-induced protein ARG7 [Syzygium oleosum]
MSSDFGSSNKIRRIVTIRQMLRRWRRKAAQAASSSVAAPPPDVPEGHVAVLVGGGCRRYVVPATHLNHPVFRRLLSRAEEEYGFANHGPLAIPCDEAAFEEILRAVSQAEDLQRCCHVGLRGGGGGPHGILGESRPLLNGVAD